MLKHIPIWETICAFMVFLFPRMKEVFLASILFRYYSEECFPPFDESFTFVDYYGSYIPHTVSNIWYQSNCLSRSCTGIGWNVLCYSVRQTILSNIIGDNLRYNCGLAAGDNNALLFAVALLIYWNSIFTTSSRDNT